MFTKVTLKIIGMHCTSCAMNIDGELEDLGVKNVTTSYAKEETSIEYDSAKISISQICDAIKKAGYKSVVK